MLAVVGAAAVFSDLAQRQFTAYGPSYWVVIAVFAIGSALLVWIGRSQTESQARRLGRILALLTAATYGSMLVYSLIPPTIGRSVPLRLTDLATVAAAYALWSQRHWPFALTYYWGLTLSTQALISPVLNSPDFPNYGFLAFWAIHLLVVWAAIYLTWGRGMRPRWRSYRTAIMVTLVWAAATFTFNSIAGTNYGFLNGKPHTASLLDVLGPWPAYLLTAATLILIVWALMTWPWERTGRRAKEPPQTLR
ncbi:TIGR02206 family membrane protein [Mycobacterium sp.]|uniref:YwaF family protein n=1 Tax=Mycobacterium sp. TaxID=1785 RepID=UPI0039C9EC6D